MASTDSEDAPITSRQGYLLAEHFRNFGPLLTACQEYARHSGCRFHTTDFALDCDEPTKEFSPAASPSHDQDQINCFLAAKWTAAPIVQDFAERVANGEAELLEELERAFRFVMVESVRNAMIGTCQRLEMWPLFPPPVQQPVEEDCSGEFDPNHESADCCYEDVSAPLPVIARRLQNDEARRQRFLVGKGGLCRLRQRAMTAAFIVDFAEAAKALLPAMPETLSMMLSDFEDRVAEWEAQPGCPRQAKRRNAGFCGVGGRNPLSQRSGREQSFCGLPMSDRLRYEYERSAARRTTNSQRALGAFTSVMAGPAIAAGAVLYAVALERVVRGNATPYGNPPPRDPSPVLAM